MSKYALTTALRRTGFFRAAPRKGMLSPLTCFYETRCMFRPPLMPDVYVTKREMKMIRKCAFYLALVILIPQISYANDMTEVDTKVNIEVKKLKDIHSNLEISSKFFFGRINVLKQKRIDYDNLFSTPDSRYDYIVEKLASVDGVILNDIDFLRISPLIKAQYKALYYSIAVARLKVSQKSRFSDVGLKAIKSLTRDQSEIKHIDSITDNLILINSIYSKLINLLQAEMNN